ncbi:hypothetical protein DFH11DRAFT_1602048 [Phellopilus nigrolimitatus]|nr:hypothetical protein DFH11DRAFT_1602048 [Phellopilus nigrolimitatus]
MFLLSPFLPCLPRSLTTAGDASSSALYHDVFASHDGLPSTATVTSPPTLVHNLAAVENTGSSSGASSSIAFTSTPSHTTSAHKPLTSGSAHSQTGVVGHSHTISFSFSFHPHTHPAPTSSPTSSRTPDSDSASNPRGHQSITAIVFEVVGGILGLALLVGCGCCLHKYHRTPRQDRIAALVDRHMLERELAEMEEARQERRVSLVCPPPPPYQRAPDYEEAVHQSPAPSTPMLVNERTGE